MITAALTELSSNIDPRSAFDQAATCTAESDRLLLPNLIIPGVQKCATTSMHAMLASHPQCCMSQQKELNFFTSGWNTRKLREYSHACFPKDCRPEPQILGESSTTYFHDVHAPLRIRELLGSEIRILILLRSPVDRAVSAYWHMAKRFADRRSPEDVFGNSSLELEDALTAEREAIPLARESNLIDTQNLANLTGDEFWNFRYIANSCYLENLKRVESVFGRNQVHIVLTEDLRTDPLTALRRVARFLEIDETGFDSSYRLNRTAVPKTNRFSRLVNAIAQKLPGGPLRRGRDLLLSATSAPPIATPPSIRRRLAALFRDHNKELASYLCRDLSVWND